MLYLGPLVLDILSDGGPCWLEWDNRPLYSRWCETGRLPQDDSGVEGARGLNDTKSVPTRDIQNQAKERYL